MEPITKADLKDLFAELRGVVKRSIAESIVEGFATWKPALEAQASGLQVAVDLLQQHVNRDKGNHADEAFAADSLDPLALMASTTPPPTTGDVIPVLAAAAASDGTFDEEANTATLDIVERSPEVILPASTGIIATAPTTCSMEGLGCDTTESRSAPAPTTTPTVHTTTVDIDPMLVAPAASAGAIVGQAISGVASTPTTYLMVCLPRYSENAAVLVASSPPTPKEYVLDTISIRVAAVPMTMTCEFYVVVHRPMPWPSFLDVHPNGDETRPLPWPSFRFSDTAFYGNISTSTDCIIVHDPCNFSEWRCLDDVLLFLEYWGSASDSVHPAHTNHALVWLSCTISGLQWLAMVRSPELKLVPIGSVFITFLTVLVDSGNFAALTCEYLGVDTTLCFRSWLFAGCLLAVCRKSPVQSSNDCYIAILIVAGLCSIMDCHLLDFPCRPVIIACLSCSQELCHYFCSSQWKETRILNSRRSNSSYAQFCFAIQDARCWSENFVTGTHMHVRATCSIRRLLMIGYVTFAPFLNLVKALSYELEESAVMDLIHVTELQDAYVSAQLQWDSIVSVHSCGLIHLEKLCPNWRFAHSAIGRPALLIPSQSVALKYMELWWYTTALLTEISSMFSTGFSMQLVVACSGKSILMLTHAYQLHILVPTKFSLAWSNLDNHAEQWDSALDCLFNAIKQFSSGPVLHMQQLSNLWGAYQIWLVAWALDVFEFSTSCGQAPFQGGRDVIRAAFSDQVRFSHDSYNDLNQALYFDTVSTDLIYYSEDSPGDSSKSNELHMPWDPGKLVLRDHRKLRLEVKPSFKEGGVLAPLPVYPMLGCYDGLAPMGRPQILSWLLIHGRRRWNGHPVGSRQRQRQRHGGYQLPQAFPYQN